jgi:hypothetical protein
MGHVPEEFTTGVWLSDHNNRTQSPRVGAGPAAPGAGDRQRTEVRGIVYDVPDPDSVSARGRPGHPRGGRPFALSTVRVRVQLGSHRWRGVAVSRTGASGRLPPRVALWPARTPAQEERRFTTTSAKPWPGSCALVPAPAADARCG